MNKNNILFVFVIWKSNGSGNVKTQNTYDVIKC